MTDEHFIILREDISTLREDFNERLDRIGEGVVRHEAEIAVLRTQSHPPGCIAVVNLSKQVAELRQDSVSKKKLWQFVVGFASAVAGFVTLALEFFRR